MHPVGIGETLRQAIAKLVMRASREQEKTSCGNLQLCAGLEAGIEGATHTVGQRRLERTMVSRQEGEEAEDSDEEEESGGVASRLTNPRIEKAGKEEEAAEELEHAWEIEVEELGEGK